MKKSQTSKLEELTLGKTTVYASDYTPDLLQAVSRSIGRDDLGLIAPLKFVGEDVWHGYELSWLNSKGKPQVALMRCIVPYSTPNIVESKSFKLYLNSLNQTRFSSHQEVQKTIAKDVSELVGGSVTIELLSASDSSILPNTALPGFCLDDLDIDIEDYALEPSRLKVGVEVVSETLHSHLLKSNCLITNQPDWASVVIEYTGKAIDREALLRYLISFRQHNEFHEQCVERIFSDIWRVCGVESLSVQALYTRRGGLDICPFRSSGVLAAPALRVNRQ